MKNLTPFFKALGEEMRLKIVGLLLPGELCVCEIMEELGLSQPAVSHHMKVLKQAGLIQDRREGKWIHYSLDQATFNYLENMLQDRLFVPVRSSAGQNTRNKSGMCR
jgi:ArsR family transcriptional regulator, arsenate/arsenite/antimonite-responsive transcriptional repressor